MRGALAEYERAKTGERTMRGRIGRVKAGHPHGGHAPLGYRYVSEPHAGHWEIEPEEAALVRRIFALCLSGMSTRAIARQLTRERVPTRLVRQQAGADERRAALAQELGLVEMGLAKCEREEQRWAEAYAGDVIHLRELKRYRGEIAR